jgi:hypothetical protein
MKVIFRQSKKEIYNHGGLLCFCDAISNFTSLESIIQKVLPKGEFKTSDCVIAYIANLAMGLGNFRPVCPNPGPRNIVSYQTEL